MRFILHNELPFLPERKKVRKVWKFVTNLHDKNEYVIHIINLQVELNHGLNLSKFHRVIKFNQNAWLKPYISTNTKIRKSKR